MKKVLITGASGFIGSYLKEHLTGFEISTLSLRDPNWKKQPIDADVVIHCAGLAHSQKNRSYDDYYGVNVKLTRKLIELTSQTRKVQIIFLSTILVYGEGHTGPISIESSIKPVSNYARTKQEAEKLFLNSNEKYGTRHCIVRIPLVLDKHAKGNLNLIKKLTRFFPVLPLIKNKRSILFLDDLSTQIINIIESNKSGILNVHSKVISTSQMFSFMSLRELYFFRIPYIEVLRYVPLRILSKLFGDSYYVGIDSNG
jgi:UDP-glucose 4-epimerase